MLFTEDGIDDIPSEPPIPNLQNGARFSKELVPQPAPLLEPVASLEMESIAS
jgi:hypothetical protein